MNEKIKDRLDNLKGNTYKPMGNGYNLYWADNELGNRVYYSDEIGGGVEVWNTTIISPETILEAVVQENEFRFLESRIK